MIRHFWNWALLIAVLVVGCNRHAPTKPAATEPIHVLSTVYSLAILTREIGGQWVSVDWVVEGANDPRDVQPSEALTEKIIWANFILTSGYKDSWATQDLTEEARNQLLIYPDQTPAGHEDRLASRDSALWLDPEVVRDLCDMIAKRLGEHDSTHSAEFRANAAAVRDRLQHLMDEHKPKMAALPQNKFMVLRPGWSALANRFGLVQVRPIDARPVGLTDQDARALSNAAAAGGIHLLVLDSVQPPAVIRDLKERTKLTPLELDLVGSSAGAGHRTYHELLEYDLEQLERGLAGNGGSK